MIGEKIGYVGVRPKRFPDGMESRYLFDLSDAVRKLDGNQSYSQMLIAWSAIKGVRPHELNLGTMKWLADGLERENIALAAAGRPTIRVGDILPM